MLLYNYLRKEMNLPDIPGIRRGSLPGVQSNRTNHSIFQAIRFCFLAERAGFEPAVHLWGHTHDFQSCSFSRSDISPRKTIFFYQYKELCKFINPGFAQHV